MEASFVYRSRLSRCSFRRWEKERERKKHVWINGTFLRRTEFSSQSYRNHSGDDDDDDDDDDHLKFCMTRRLVSTRATAVAFAVERYYFLDGSPAISSKTRGNLVPRKKERTRIRHGRRASDSSRDCNDRRAWYIKSPFSGNARFPMNS